MTTIAYSQGPHVTNVTPLLKGQTMLYGLFNKSTHFVMHMYIRLYAISFCLEMHGLSRP